jgi:hypothetical protein
MQQQVVRTRPPNGSHIDFVLPGLLVAAFLFMGLALWAMGYNIAGAAMSGAAALGLLQIQFRARAFDRHIWLSANPILVEQPEPAPITQTQYAQQTNTPAGQVLTYSNITLPDSDWLPCCRVECYQDLQRVDATWRESQRAWAFATYY